MSDVLINDNILNQDNTSYTVDFIPGDGNEGSSTDPVGNYEKPPSGGSSASGEPPELIKNYESGRNNEEFIKGLPEANKSYAPFIGYSLLAYIFLA